MCVHVWISFFENPKMFVWHEKCSFDNPVENFSPKVRKLFARTSKIITKLYFSSKSIPRGNNIFARKRFSIKERAGGGLNATFDSQTENFLSQRVQSTNSIKTEFYWLSTQ